MRKGKKFKVGIVILYLFFNLLYFSIQFGGIGQRINNETIRDKKVIPFLSAGNSASVKWNRTWGGVNDDYGYGVAVDSSNMVYITGSTLSFGAPEGDMVLVKYNGKGRKQWNQTWGGKFGSYGNAVAVDSSDNVYVIGETYGFGVGGLDMVLVKYNRNGEQQWNRTWGGVDFDWGKGVAVDSLDNVYLVGGTESFGVGGLDMVLVKYDKNGVQQWNRTWGGGTYDGGEGVTVDSLDNIYVAGYTLSFGAGDYDIFLVKYDENGVQEWNCTWGGINEDVGYGVAVDLLGNVYLAGYTENFGAEYYDIVLVKYDSSGMQQWNRTWGGYYYNRGFGVAVDSSGNVFIAGETYGFGVGGLDMVLVKYNRNGVLQWDRIWGGDDDDGESIRVAVDSLGNVYLVGCTRSFGAGRWDMVLVKFSNVERPPFDEFIMILIIVMSIASVVGVSIAITYVIRKRRNVVE